MGGSMTVFDRRVVRMHRDRAAAQLWRHDFLLQDVGDRLLDRLNDIRRRFPLALDLGCHGGQLASQLNGRGGVNTLIHCDLSLNMAKIAPSPRLVADEEALPFAEGCFDLVLSLLSLHWVNDLPGCLSQVRHALKPDGLFLAALLGGQTLKELRHALAEAEIGGEGGLSPRIAPFADVRDAGNLMQRAGFTLPVVDTETITVTYDSVFTLLGDLRGMGETNAVLERRKSFSRRRTLHDAAKRYHGLFADKDGRIPATFQVIYLTGWSPHDSQPKPLARGSATMRLAEALSAMEPGVARPRAAD